MTYGENFRLGFIRAMRDIQDRKNGRPVEDMWDEITTDIFAFAAGFDYFFGRVDNGTRQAERLGLTRQYEGFKGQGDWVHPKYRKRFQMKIQTVEDLVTFLEFPKTAPGGWPLPLQAPEPCPRPCPCLLTGLPLKEPFGLPSGATAG